MAPKHASETAAMNIYESSYDLSWASPTLKAGYSFTVIHLDLSFWIQRLVQISCGGRYGFKPETSRSISGGLVFFWTPKTYKYQTPSLKRGYIAWMSIGCFSPHGTCQVLLLVLRRTTIVPRKRCQVMSKSSVVVETRIRRLVRIGGLNARSFGSGGYDFAGK